MGTLVKGRFKTLQADEGSESENRGTPGEGRMSDARAPEAWVKLKSEMDPTRKPPDRSADTCSCMGER
jgi:hypothetical protein